MASSNIVNGEELGEPERRPLNPSAKGFIISLGKHSAISQGTKDIEKSNTDTMNKFITHCSGNGAEDGRTSSGNVISGYEGVCGTTFGVIDNKADTTGEIVDVTGCELSSGDKRELGCREEKLDTTVQCSSAQQNPPSSSSSSHCSDSSGFRCSPGSLIHMAGPKRGIQLIGTNLIEYDMKIKTVMGAQMDLKFKVATDSCIPAEHLLFRRGDRD
ncbi:Os08g0372166 [Oryza sativa Japonica Group]|uniref:Os08g0372166 protein n=1 Tax=Oryza sativa subsp. japonica TaxID=39947 RepID=C7J5Y3_ORYSJ|nr:Os08g0372166 [Oryza sativa Japonica Group]|eukprot:NP_001175547.1 Os08g0372166 [Oryza sativa Japonica Group]